MLLLEPDVFVGQLAAPMLPRGGLPRGYLAREDYSALGFVARARRFQLRFLDRLVRFVLWTRGVPVTMLAMLSDQHIATVYLCITCRF